MPEPSGPGRPLRALSRAPHGQRLESQLGIHRGELLAQARVAERTARPGERGERVEVEP
jgi:hypothetical protein